MWKTLLGSVTGLFSGWAIYVILALVASNAITYALWQRASKELVAFEVSGMLAKEEKERVENEHNQALKDVTTAWEKYSKDSTRRAIAAYDAKYHWDTCVQPGTVPVPVPGNADGTEALHGAESERRTCTTKFIETCVNDAAFRGSVRLWITKSRLKVDD